jgi:hypothetical protein
MKSAVLSLRKYTPEYTTQALKRALAGRAVTQMGIAIYLLRNWVTQQRLLENNSAQQVGQAVEMARLKRALTQKGAEVADFKQAVGYFAKDSQ